MQGKVSFKEDAMSAVYVGVDVCKEWLDIHVHPSGESRRFGNDTIGIRQLQRMLARCRPQNIVMEATGKFHRPAHRSLFVDGFAVAIVDPLRARLFARSCGYLAKTDRLDARLLAVLAASLRPEPDTPPSPHVEALQELVNALSAAQGEITAFKNRSKAAATAFLRAELSRMVKRLEQHVQRLDAEIERRIGKDPQLSRKAEILTSIPGIGRITAMALMAGWTSWAGVRANRLPCWRAWPRSQTTAALAPAAALSGPADLYHGGRSTWPQCRHDATTRHSQASPKP